MKRVGPINGGVYQVRCIYVLLFERDVIVLCCTNAMKIRYCFIG